jgi:hypothetical protein
VQVERPVQRVPRDQPVLRVQLAQGYLDRPVLWVRQDRWVPPAQRELPVLKARQASQELGVQRERPVQRVLLGQAERLGPRVPPARLAPAVQRARPGQ